MKTKAYHGGAFFSAIGEDFSNLNNTKSVIGADVLDAWFDPSPKVLEKISEYLPFALKTSPPTYCEGLISTIAQYRGVHQDNILVGAGSSDIMFRFFPAILDAHARVLILDPMYGEYAHILQHVVPVNLTRHLLSASDDFQINVDKFQNDIDRTRPHMVVLVNPNSPTGKYLDRELVLHLADRNRDTLFVVDETYIEYVGSDHSIERSVMEKDNLIVIKSMSKAYALSGARVAYMVADSSVLNRFSYLMPPWAVGLIAQIAGVEALKDKTYYEEKYLETHRLRLDMQNAFKVSSKVRVYSSVANFFLAELLDRRIGAAEIITLLRQRNMFLRNCDSMSEQFRNNFLRIAVKDKETNDKIVNALLGI